jgi:hypothetical protein
MTNEEIYAMWPGLELIGDGDKYHLVTDGGGYTNHTLNLSHAQYILRVLRAEGADVHEILRRWDYYASAQR